MKLSIGSMSTLGVSAISILAASGLPGVAGAQTIAYEGFNYTSPASLLGQNGGTGFSTAWQSAGYGSWAVDATDSLYIKNSLRLLTSGGRSLSSLGGYQRTMTLGSPIGNTPGSVWIAFVAQHSTGSTSGSWLGVTLPCSGSANPSLFLGKPFGQPNWGSDAGLGGTIRQTTTSCKTQALIVARIDTRAGADDVHVWINPDLSGTPSDASADLSLLAYGDFAGITKLLVETGTPVPFATSGVIDEIRVGHAFAEVAPVKPGVILNGFEAVGVGGAVIGPVTADRRLPVHNLGSSGNDGVEIKLRSVSGAGVVINSTGTPNAPGATLRTKYKGWDGTIKGRCTSVTNADGSMTSTFDYTSMGATAVNIVKLDEHGVEVYNVTTAGPLGTVLMPPPCPAGSQWSWPKWYDLWYGGTHYLGMFCNDPINPIGRVQVTPEFPPGTNPDTSVASMIITGSGMGEFDISEPTGAFQGAAVTGLGDVLLREDCDDGSDCTDAARRRYHGGNLGSSGQDGVEVKFRTAPPSTSGTFTMGDVLNSDGEGLVVCRYLFGLSGSSLNVTGGGGGGGGGLVTPDFSAVGSTEYMVTGYLNGVIVHEEILPNGTGVTLETDQIICGPGNVIVWGWVTMYVYCQPYPFCGGSWQTFWGIVGCMSLRTGATGPYHMDSVRFSPVNPVVISGSSGIASVSITGRNTPPIVLTGVSSTDTIPCPADFNGDGAVDFFDYDDFVNCFEGHACPENRTADFNSDTAVDFFDYDDFVHAFETPC